MSEANKQLVIRWYNEVWNDRNESAIDAMYSPQGKAYGFPDPGSVVEGPEAFKQVHRVFCGAFPDLRVTVEQLVAEGDFVAARWRCDMTHSGDHLGFPASGKKVVFSGSSFLVIKDGLIMEGQNYMDKGALFQHLQAPA
jgi:steroid delta-isomerase-like uncharacterized protein